MQGSELTAVNHDLTTPIMFANRPRLYQSPIGFRKLLSAGLPCAVLPNGPWLKAAAVAKEEEAQLL
jgi:hypothetical protein